MQLFVTHAFLGVQIIGFVVYWYFIQRRLFWFLNHRH